MTKNLLEAKRKTTEIISNEINVADLRNINIENLNKGLDSEGQDMPLYSNTPYGIEKSNPLNRGHWDLKKTGQYHLGITAKILNNKITFKQRYDNKKIRWLDMMLDKANRNPLGITLKQYNDYLSTKRPKMQEKLIKIIKNGL